MQLRMHLLAFASLRMFGVGTLAAGAVAVDVTLVVNTSHTAGTVDDHFLGVDLGSWDKLAQGPNHHVRLSSSAAGARASTLARPAAAVGSWPTMTCDEYFERDPRLLMYLKQLAPGYIRFGDLSYFYAGVGDGDLPVPSVSGDANTVISRECFDRVGKFASDAGMSVYLLGNMQYGLDMHLTDTMDFDTCPTKPQTKPHKLQTNWTNLRHLLEHAKRTGMRIAAVDVSGEGNDMMARCPIPGVAEKWPHIMANATRALKTVLAEVWPDGTGRPKLVGPMMGYLPGGVCGVSGPQWMEIYLRDVGPNVLDAISYDWYPEDSRAKKSPVGWCGGAGDATTEDAVADMMRP